MISIRTLKICEESILKPLEIIYKSCIKKDRFLHDWKKAYVVPVHSKGDISKCQKITELFHYCQFVAKYLNV